jgi:hypothetical protein
MYVGEGSWGAGLEEIGVKVVGDETNTKPLFSK